MGALPNEAGDVIGIQHAYGVVGLGLVNAMLLLAVHPRVRRGVIELLKQLGARVMDCINQSPEFDELADDISNALRREQLRFDVQRLQRILATDMSMSATRQMGNRLAYDWLVRELDKSTRNQPTSFLDDYRGYGSDIAAVQRLAGDFARYERSGPPKVEILEIGWRH